MGVSRRDEHCIATVAHRHSLTPKQTLVLIEWVFTEQSVEQIGAKLGNAPSTIRGHIKHVYRAVGVHGRGELIRRVLQADDASS